MGGQGRKAIIPLFLPKRYRKRCGLPKPLPLGATATTAASGGNREELLGQRPARRKRSAADAGSRNPGSVTEGDGEGKPGRKEPLRSDGQALCQSDTIAVQELFGSGLALSVGLAPASSPKGGAIGMSVSFRLDEQSTMSRKR